MVDVVGVFRFKSFVLQIWQRILKAFYSLSFISHINTYFCFCMLYVSVLFCFVTEALPELTKNTE